MSKAIFNGNLATNMTSSLGTPINIRKIKNLKLPIYILFEGVVVGRTDVYWLSVTTLLVLNVAL